MRYERIVSSVAQREQERAFVCVCVFPDSQITGTGW
uniref:Uncharacterized protein n=1 Tax=Anguilla anguilla TaxID=7936 RepID=A0A0E9Q9N1_ANGAN